MFEWLVYLCWDWLISRVCVDVIKFLFRFFYIGINIYKFFDEGMLGFGWFVFGFFEGVKINFVSW